MVVYMKVYIFLQYPSNIQTHDVNFMSYRKFSTNDSGNVDMILTAIIAGVKTIKFQLLKKICVSLDVCYRNSDHIFRIRRHQLRYRGW